MSLKQALKPWLISIIAGMFFFFEFMQINMFNDINAVVSRAFALDPFHLGLLSSIFFYTTVALIIPAGQILDRFSPRRVILTTMSSCIVGITIFASAHTFEVAALGRLLEGIGSAFCFVSGFKVAATWFEMRKLPLMAGVLVAIGMSGGLVAQAPLNYLVVHFGWRHALYIDAAFGVFVLFLIFLLVKNNPQARSAKSVMTNGIWAAYKSIYGNINNWICALYSTAMNAPFAVLGAVWGMAYLHQVHGLTSDKASLVMTFLFLGTVIGSPIVGWLVGRVGSFRVVMSGGVIMSLLLFAGLLDVHSVWALSLIMLGLGISTSTQTLGYPLNASMNKHEYAAMSASIVSFTIMFSYLVLQPLFGWVLEHSTHVTPVAHFHEAMLIIPIAFVVAGVCLVVLRVKRYE